MNAQVDRAAWLAERRRGVGGSDVHHVFNQEPYGCARQLWFDKRAVAPDFVEDEAAVMQRGTRLEDLVAELYVERTGRAIERRPAITSQARPWARVNLDRAIVGDGPVTERLRAMVAERGPGALEIKTHNDFLFRKVKRDGLQAGHIFQLQHALMVTGYAWGAYAVLHPDSWQLLHFDVARDDGLIALIAEAGERFWRMVEHGPMPEPLPEIDRRCKTCPWRRQCRGDALLAAAGPLGREDAAAELAADEGLAPLLVDFREAERMADAANETLDVVKASIRTYLGERPGARCSEGKVYFREQVAMRIDAKGLEIAHPDIVKQFKRPSTSRPLRVYTA